MDPLADIPSASTPTLTTSDPLADIPKADTSLSDSHNEAAQYNPDHVAKALDLSKAANVDPSYVLGNLPAVEKAALAPEPNIKTRNPALFALLNSSPHVMGIGFDDVHPGGSLALLEDNVKTARIASSLLDAARAGWQDSVRGRELARHSPDLVLGPEPSLLHESVAMGVGMAVDLPEFMIFGAVGGLAGPVTGMATAFGGHAALKQALIERDHGDINSAAELIRRAKAVAEPGAKGALVGASLALSGATATAYGASAAAKLAMEVGAMTTTSAAVEGRTPTTHDFVLNSIAFLGAHAASMSWAKMGEIAQGSKIRGRGEVGAQTFADHADTVSGPAYIPIEKWDALHGANVETMNRNLGIEKAYAAAKASGGDVEIPAGKFLSSEMDTHRDKLTDDVKSNPEAKTVNQLKDAEAEQKKLAEKAAAAPEEKPTLPYNPYPGLSVKQRAVETDLAKTFSKPEAVEKYNALPGTEGGKILDVDEARSISDAYNENNATRMAYTLATHKPSSAFIKKLYFDKLAEPAKGPVLFMAGGGGSGKSTVRKAFLSDVSANADIIMDGTFAKQPDAIEKIEAALSSGRNVTIAYVHRPFEAAVKGVVSRTGFEKVGGRWVPSEVMAEDHVMSQETYKALAERYRGDPRVTLKAFENPEAASGEHVSPRPIELDALHERSYTKEGEHPTQAVERLTKIAREHNGKIESAAEEAGRLSGNEPQAPGDESGDRRVDGEGVQGPEGEGQAAVAFPDPLQAREQATSKAVSSAQHETGQNDHPLPGVDPIMQTELDRARESARKEAEKILLKPQLEELKRENKTLLNTERQRATAEIKNQVNNEPVFKAISLLDMRKDEMWKHANRYLNDDLPDIDAHGFEAIAEMSGFTSANEMARSLLLTDPTPTFNMRVKARLEEHMAQFASLKDTEAMREQALQAVHTDESGKLIALQQQVLEGMAQNAEINAETAKARRAYANEMWEASKRMAKDVINSKPVESAGRFRAYYTAERNAALKAQKLEAAGKYQEAGAARLEQMHSHALAAESLRVRDNIDRWQRSIEKQQKADPLTWKDQDHFFQAASIMARFGFERRDYQPSKRIESLSSWEARMEENTNTVEIADWLKDESISKDWRKITPTQLQDVRNALKNIKHVASFEDQAYVVFDKADLNDVAKQLLETQQANAHNGKTAPLSMHQTFMDKVVASKDAAMFQLISPETWLRKLDGYKNFGAWQRAFYEQYARGADNKAQMLVEAAEGYAKIWEAYTPKEREAMSKKIFLPELNDSLMKSEIMTMALNYGSESNKGRLLEGRNWTDMQVKNILDREMTKRDWDTVQATWDHINSMWPKIAELYRDLTGFEPEKIAAQKVITPHGEYAGGYFPLRSDPRVEVRGATEQDVSASLAEAPPAWRASTKNGFTKGRVEGAQYKVSLDINGIQRHMTDVIHDLTMRKWVLDANRMLARKDVQASISDALGMDGYRMLNDWVKSVAGTNEFQSREFLGDFFHGLRRRTIIANLGLRISSTILQVDDISAYGSVDPNFGVANAAMAVTGFYGQVTMSPGKFHEGVEFVYARSKYMKYERGENIDRDIKDAARREFGSDDKMAKASMVMVSTVDKLLSIPVWKEAYKKGLELHEGSEQKAVDYADLIIRRAQASGRIGELAAIMRGSEKQKALTMFYSFMNRRLNLWYEAIDKTKGISDAPRLAGTAMALWVVPTLFSSLVHNGLPSTPEKKKKYMKEMLLYPTGLFPVIRDVADFAITKAMGMKGFGYSPTPMTRGVETFGNMVGTLASKEAKTGAKVEAVAKAGAYAVPYPDQANVWLFNTADILSNGAKPRLEDLVKRRPKKERSR